MFLKLRAEPGIGEVSREKQAIFMENRCFFVCRAEQGERGARKTVEITPASAARRRGWDRRVGTFCGSSSLRFLPHKGVNGIVG